MSITYNPNIQYLSTIDTVDGSRSVDVLYDGQMYGCSFFENDVHLTITWYPNKSRYWADDAAMNYIEGRLNVTGSQLLLNFEESTTVDERIG